MTSIKASKIVVTEITHKNLAKMTRSNSLLLSGVKLFSAVLYILVIVQRTQCQGEDIETTTISSTATLPYLDELEEIGELDREDAIITTTKPGWL